MRRKTTWVAIIGWLAFVGTGIAQDAGDVPHKLVKTSTVQSSSVASESLLLPIKCDQDGKVYLQFMGDPMAPAEDTKSVTRISRKAEVDAQFALKDASLGDQYTGRDYAIDSDGQVAMLAETPEGYTVVRFDKDGKFKSKFLLEDRLRPFQLALFKSGQLLIAGTETPSEGAPERGAVPFTAIFDESGKMLKEVSLEDDKQFTKGALEGDSRYVPSGNHNTNRAVTLGESVSGEDGNVYVMRWASPAIVYVISPGGAVLRKLTIDPHEEEMRPRSLFLSKGRVAIQFADSKEPLLIVANAESGKVEGTYSANLELGGGLACYSTEEVTFVGNKDGKLALHFAQLQ
ncbi:MAG: hypothetical protein HYX28_10070 [Candidatus Koribacter versatilis]|uniref:Uncharacterized protein n=1 Tax=Candidatus Korobacter versatilis TaxID=658062 RepID=A0A932A9C6_9BACT|nr:hypothetical protein [Candidatus Koribacter versatilis]